MHTHTHTHTHTNKHQRVQTLGQGDSQRGHVTWGFICSNNPSIYVFSSEAIDQDFVDLVVLLATIKDRKSNDVQQFANVSHIIWWIGRRSWQMVNPHRSADECRFPQRTIYTCWSAAECRSLQRTIYMRCSADKCRPLRQNTKSSSACTYTFKSGRRRLWRSVSGTKIDGYELTL